MLPLAVISGLAGFSDRDSSSERQKVQKLGIAIILGGAISNLYDRVVRRYVVDYFSIQCGKLKGVVFNLGDIFCISWFRHPVWEEIIKEIRSAFFKENSG